MHAMMGLVPGLIMIYEIEVDAQRYHEPEWMETVQLPRIVLTPKVGVRNGL